MREHQMNEYQCPYCLHGDAEKERLLSHLLNCHSGRPGKVLLRKQITSSVSSTAPCPEILAPLPQQPPPSSAISENDSNCDGLNSSKDSVVDKPGEEIKPVSQANLKNLPKVSAQINSNCLNYIKNIVDYLTVNHIYSYNLFCC